MNCELCKKRRAVATVHRMLDGGENSLGVGLPVCFDCLSRTDALPWKKITKMLYGTTPPPASRPPQA
jgi:hypothetical protein